ncbi:MAG: transporter substrate-binding domain-containing protein [Gammaproteobacteria bacterium]|nr:transporter substrate-binding domain-containing protein [Gammaproteobacteria bacterium]
MTYGRLRMIALGLAMVVVVAQAEPARVGFGSHNAPPYAYLLPNQPTIGLISDLASLLAESSGRPVTMMAYARENAAELLERGDLDLICITNPAWLSDRQQQRFWWSKPLFVERNLLVVNSASGWLPQQLNELQGRRIGMVRGYRYPTLEQLPVDQQPERIDAASPFDQLLALSDQQLDGVVVADLQYDHYRRISPGASTLKLAPIPISSHPVHCAFSREQPANQQLQQALDLLIDEGAIATTVNRYRRY